MALISTRSLLSRLILGATLSFGAQAGLAQVTVDPAATGGLNVNTAPNGVPLIDIATPNAGGLSHNLYGEFNVGSEGLILNNQNGTFGNSQLGGVVPGNPNLTGVAPARVILNEVAGTNRSELGGVIEVAGQSADVIVANPNGITCNGCGFIRTPRAVLTTGTPDVNGGTLQGFTVNGGDILIGANGADLSDVRLFDIISRQVTFEGAVAGGDEVRVAAGRNAFAYDSGAVTALADDGSTGPAFGIDSTAVGGLYAGRITLLSTEAGVAVRAPREMAASAGGMTLTADGRLVIGRAQATGPVTVRSAAPVVVQTSLFSGDAITLEGVSAELANNATVAAEGDLTVTTSGGLTLGSGALAAAGMDSAGTLGTSGDLTFSGSGALNATGARIAAAGDADLSFSTMTLNQSGGAEALTIMGDLALDTAALTANGASAMIGGDFDLTSPGALAITGGDYAIGGDLMATGTTLNTSADFDVAGAATLEATSGALTNSGDLDTGGALALTASGAMTNSGDIRGGATGDLSAGGNFNNTGSIVMAGALSVEGANITNSDALGSSDGDVNLTTIGDITNSGLIYAGQNLTMRLDGAFENLMADIIAEGGITIRGESGARAASVLNRSAQIEAITGAILIAATSVENSQTAPTVITETETTVREGTNLADFPGGLNRSNTTRFVETTETTRMVVQPGTDAPAAILAGGDLTINANTILNNYSQIAAGGDMTLNAGTVTNTGLDLIETNISTTVTHYRVRVCTLRILGFCLNRSWRDRSATGVPITTTATTGAVFSTIQAGGTLTATVTGYLGNNAVRDGVAQVGLSSGGRALSAPPLIGSVNPNAILNRSALFTPTQNPNAPFLIETRDEFIDVSRFLSSDYFLQQIGGYDANITQRRFGDAYVEARLIQEQLFALTGRRAADDPDELRDLMARMYDNAVDAAEGLQLTPGVALSPEQVAALTENIIWLEEQIIDGQAVLVPVVYLGANGAEGISLAGAQIAAADVDIDSGTVANTGAITAEQDLEIATDTDLINIGGQIEAGGDAALDVEGRLANVSGQINAGGDIDVDAGELENSTALIRDESGNGFADRVQQIGEIAAGSDLDIDVEGDLSSEGGQFTAGGDATLDAGGDVAIGALMVETSREDEFGNGSDSGFTRDAELAGVTAGGDLEINAGEDLTIAGADIEAGGDAALTAEGDVTISSVQEVEQEDVVWDINGGGLFGVDTDIREQDQEVTTEQTTISAGGNLTIASGEGDVTLEAPALESGGETVIAAEEGTVSILTTEDSAFTRDEFREEDLLWWNEEDEGSSEISRTFTTIEAGGGLQIISGGDIVVDYVATGDFNEGIAQLAAAPGLEWMADLAELEDGVYWQAAETAFEEWDYESQGLTEAGALLVTTIVSFATSGLTAGWAESITQGLGFATGGAAEAAIQAGLRNLVSTASVSLVNNGGDIGAVLEELASGDSFRGLITAMVSAGLGSHLVDAAALSGPLGEGATFTEVAIRDLQADLIRATVNAGVSTAINGGDFGEALFDSWTNAMVMSGLSIVQNEIGDIVSEAGLEEGSFPHVIAHAVAGGLAAELLGEDFADGALGAAVAALSGELIGNTNLSAERQAELTGLIATAAVLIANDGNAGGASLAGAIATSLDENNRQLHTREIQALEAYAQSLDGVDGKTAEEWLQELTLQAMRNVDNRAANQIADNPDAQVHIDILIAQNGETFTNGLGGLMGFLNETNPELRRNTLANLDHVVANREFYDAALSDWAPRQFDGLQGILSATDIILLDSVRFAPYETVDRLVPEELSDLPAEVRRAAGTLQVMGLLQELTDVHARLIAAQDEVFASGNDQAIDAFLTAQNELERDILEGAYLVTQQLRTGMIRGAAGEVVGGFSAMLLFGADQASMLVGAGELTGAADRNSARMEAFVQLIENFDELPANVQAGLASRAEAMETAMAEGRFEDAGEILGEFNVYAASAATGTVGLTAGSANLLRRLGDLGGVPSVGRNGSTIGSVDDANFAQTSIRSDREFSPDGQQIYSDLAGYEIVTVDDLATAILNGDVSPSDIPVDYVDLNGVRLILNTRTSTALQNAGVPRSEWYGTQRTGEVAYTNDNGVDVTFDELATNQLNNNDLPDTGSPTLPTGE
ncbi:two-partner secretion domain-containing protein [Gymnodinialimonas hymeniacidonis]|uniref:two-partner secretion domain-containing protein n=1 Tax=Gymnodinialimonas hymeniacidonis TaxID=3126508 RepID=UPI0034C6730A